jgi:hypothetical protein
VPRADEPWLQARPEKIEDANDRDGDDRDQDRVGGEEAVFSARASTSQ